MVEVMALRSDQVHKKRKLEPGTKHKWLRLVPIELFLGRALGLNSPWLLVTYLRVFRDAPLFYVFSHPN